MKIIKILSTILFSLFFMGMFVPQLSAKEQHNYHHKYQNKYQHKYHHRSDHHYHKHKYKSRSSALSLNLNMAPYPSYTEYNYISRPACYETVTVAPYRPYVEQRIYYPYSQQVIVQRPSTGIYIQPQLSFSSFLRY